MRLGFLCCRRHKLALAPCGRGAAVERIFVPCERCELFLHFRLKSRACSDPTSYLTKPYLTFMPISEVDRHVEDRLFGISGSS